MVPGLYGGLVEWLKAPSLYLGAGARNTRRGFEPHTLRHPLGVNDVMNVHILADFVKAQMEFHPPAIDWDTCDAHGVSLSGWRGYGCGMRLYSLFNDNFNAVNGFCQAPPKVRYFCLRISLDINKLAHGFAAPDK